MIFAGCFVLSLYIGWLKKASGNVWNGGGDVPRRYWLSLPLWCPAGWFSPCGTGSPAAVVFAGGLNPSGTGYPCRCGALRGAQGGGRLLTLPLVCFSAPYPPARAHRALFPSGEGGESKFSYARGSAPCILGACSARHWLGGRQRCPAGAHRGWSSARPAPPHVPGGCVPFSSPANPAFSVVSAPYPPSPLPRRGRGSPKVYFAGGFAPGTPALDRSRHLQTFPNRSPAQRGVRGWSPEWQEMLFFGQCRQPRRGGTGGDGTIRRK